MDPSLVLGFETALRVAERYFTSIKDLISLLPRRFQSAARQRD